jgi:hypothetical protein
VTKRSLHETRNVTAVVLIAITCFLSLSCEELVQRSREIFAGETLTGTWYVNGDQNKRAEIVSTSTGLQARNENGDSSRLNVERNGDIRALDWEGGLQGNVSRNRITGRIALTGHASRFPLA